MTIGEHIKSLRTEKRLSQQHLASLAGVSNAEISRLETGERKKVSPETLKKLAPHLGTTYERLMEVAGYVETIVDRETFQDHVWTDSDGNFLDTYRKPFEHIMAKDADLIMILDRAVNRASPKDMETIKLLLMKMASSSIDEQDRELIRKFLEKF